jgi:hypothetical protein
MQDMETNLAPADRVRRPGSRGDRGSGGRVRRGLLGMGLVVGAASQLGFSCEATCVDPYRPVGGDELALGEEPSGTWPVPATAVPRPVVAPPLDTDGDGNDDAVEVRDDLHTLVVHRSSGDLVLGVAPPAQVFGDSPSFLSAGDVDGDGRTDLIVSAYTRPPANGADRPPMIQYLVSGATPDGVHPVESVGSTLVPPGDAWPVDAVGDIDGDGLDDLALLRLEDPEGPGGIRVWPGADLTMAPGTGETAPSLQAPAGAFVGAVSLDGREALVIVTHRSTDDERYHELVVWVPEGGLSFTTAGAGPAAAVQPIGLGQASGQARVADDPGASGDRHDRWLTLTLEHRTLRQRWAWDLDTLCANTPVPA